MGARVGTIFVELDLDTKRWSAAQKRILNDARMTGLDVEKNFKNLGVKSEALWDMMKGQAINALVGIKHSSTSTTNDIIVAEKAAAIKHKAIQDGKINQMKKVEAQYAALFDEAIAKENAANAESQLAKIKYDKEYTSFWSTELKKRETVEEASRAKQNAANQEYWLARMAHEKAAAAEGLAIRQAALGDYIAMDKARFEATAINDDMIAKSKAAQLAEDKAMRQAALGDYIAMDKARFEATAINDKMIADSKAAQLVKEKAIRQAAHAEYLAMENARTEAQIMNAQKRQQAEQARWNTLGIRSEKAIKEEIAAVKASHRQITNSKHASTNDIINAERAKNAKLKVLNSEMVGDHQMSMAAMTRAVLRFYAAYFVISQVGRVVVDVLMDGVKAIDDMKISAISVAAQITSMQGSAGDITENYKQNLAYAEALVPVLMKIDASSFANLTQIQRINMAMTNQGVLLDTNNAKQVRSFTALTNAIALFTVGQNKEKQATQETRALMTGQIKMTDMVAMQLDSLIKKEGIYAGGLKEIVKLGREHKDTLERLEPYLIGVIAASGDIGKTWEAVSSSMDTAFTIMQKELFADFYKDLIDSGLDLVDAVKDNTEKIVDYFKDIWEGINIGIKASIGGFLALRVAGVRTAMALKASFSGFVLFMEGWTFGTYLNNEFKNVRLMGIGLVDGLNKMFIDLEYGAKIAWAGIGSMWETVVNDMKEEFVGFVNSMADAFEYLPFGDETAKMLRGWADGIKPVTTATESFTKAEEKANAERNKSLDIHNRTIEAMRKKAESMGSKKPTGTVKRPKTPEFAGNFEEFEKKLKGLTTNIDAMLQKAVKLGDIPTTEKLIGPATRELEVHRAELLKNIEDYKLLRDEAITFGEKGSLAVDQLNMKILESQLEIEAMGEGFAAIADSSKLATLQRYTTEMKSAVKEIYTENEKGSDASNKAIADLIKKYESLSGSMVFSSDAGKKGEQAFIDYLNTLKTKTEDMWKNTRDIMQNAIQGSLSDAMKGELDSIEDYMNSFVNSMIDMWAGMVSQMVMKDVLAAGTGQAAVGGLASMNPAMMGVGVGLMGASALMGGNNEPSYGKQLSSALAPMVNELQKNTEATRKNTMAMLDTLDFSSGSIFSNIQSRMSENVFRDRDIFQNVALPPIQDWEGYDGMQGILDDLSDGITPWWGKLKAQPEELTGIFNTIFKGLAEEGGQGLVELSNIFVNLNEGNIRPLIANLDRLDDTFELSNEEINLLTDAFSKGSVAMRNMGEVGNYLVDTIANIFAEIEGKATSAYVSLRSTMESMAETYGTTLTNIIDTEWGGQQRANPFNVALTSSAKAEKEFNSAFGPMKEEYQNIIDLHTKGMIQLEPEVEAFYYYFISAVEDIGKAIEKTFADARSEIQKSMIIDLRTVTGQFSELKIAYMSIADQAEEYYDNLVDNGMTLSMAATKTDEWTASMQKATAQAMMSATASDLKMRRLQALGNEEGVLAYQRELELKDLATTYGEGTTAYKKFSEDLKDIWRIEDANAAKEAWETAHDSLMDFYTALKTKLQDLIWDLQGGNLAAVQSQEGMMERYNTLFQEAATTGNVDRFSSFISGEFSQFMRSYGNWGEVSGEIVKDLQTLQTKLVDEASMSDINNTLGTANISLQEIVNQTTIMANAIAGTNGFAAGGYHSGGLRVVGERGWEVESRGPSRITNQQELKSLLGSSGSGTNVQVVVKMGTKEFNDFTTEVIRTDEDAQKQIRRVAQG